MFFLYLARKNPTDDSTPDKGTVYIRRRVTIISGPLTVTVTLYSVPVDIIYINICLEWCQYVTDRQVVVTLVVPFVLQEQQNFRLPDPNKDYNPSTSQERVEILAFPRSSKVLDDSAYGIHPHALGEY